MACQRRSSTPPGPGPTGFSTLSGKMGVGRLFEAVNTRTGETIIFGSYGGALEHAHQPIVRCDFPVPPDVSPDGTSDWLFRVTGFFAPDPRQVRARTWAGP